MPIDFKCTQCGKLLRTPDDTAGKKAKCPDCGAVLTIPAAAGVPPLGPPIGPPPQASANPYASPFAAPMPGVSAVPAAQGITPSRLDFGDVFGTSWQILTNQLGMCILGGLVAMLLMGFGSTIIFYVPVLIGLATRSIILLVAFGVIGYVAALLFTSFVVVGVLRYFLAIARGQPANIGDIFSGGPYFVRMVLTVLLISLGAFAILFVCSLPGVVIAFVSPGLGFAVQIIGMIIGYVALFIGTLMISQAYFLIVDRNAGVVESLQLSYTITNGNKLILFVLWLVMMAIYGLSFLACGLGWLFTLPWLMVTAAVCYLRMTGQPLAAGPAGSVPPQV